MRTSQETRPGLSHGIDLRGKRRGGAPRGERVPLDALPHPFDAANGWCACRRSATLFWKGFLEWRSKPRAPSASRERILMSKWNDNALAQCEAKIVRLAAVGKASYARGVECRDCDRLRSWRTCPVRLCRRVRGCSGDSDPQPCMAERSPKLPETSNDDVRTAAAKSAAALPVMSAAEAAAAIKASIANAPR
jgi:hypothetical protein